MTMSELAKAPADPMELCVASLQGDLSRSPYAAIRALSCDCARGRVVVRGCVPNFYTRQVALNVLARYSDLLEFDDQIKVRVP